MFLGIPYVALTHAYTYSTTMTTPPFATIHHSDACILPHDLISFLKADIDYHYAADISYFDIAEDIATTDN